MLSPKNIKFLKFFILIGVLQGCANIHKSPPASENTAEVTIEFLGNHVALPVGIFEEGKECRSGGLVPLDENNKRATVRVKAETTSVELGTAHISDMFIETCGGIFSFEASPGGRYIISHNQTTNGCRIRLHERMRDEIIDVSNLLVARTTKRHLFPGPRNRPFCSDEYQPQK